MRCKPHHIAVVSLLLISCNLFQTREPENPVSGSNSLEQATSPGIVINNLQASFQQKNIQEYEKLFNDTMIVFAPTPSAAARYSVVFSSWNRSAESNYFRNMITAVGTSSAPQLALTVVSTIQYQNDSAHYTLDYTIFVPNAATNQFTGRTDLVLSPNKNAIWSIYRWIDYETKKDSSWSELKGQFAK